MFLQNNGKRIYYEDRGSGSAVLFIHGLGGAASMWFSQAQALASHYRTIIYDWSGSGNSGKNSGEYSIEQWADEARDLCGALGIQKAAAVGHSMGAAVATSLAARHPDLVTHLCLAGPVMKLGPAGVEAITARAAAVCRDGMAAVVDALPQGALAPATRAGNPAVHALFRAMLLAHDPESYAAHCEALLRLDAIALVSAVRVPVLLMAGDSDPTAPAAAVQELAARFANGRALVLPSAGHAMQLDQPDRVSEALRGFLQEDA
jgi:3-oxoadipate enol-lactonase